MPGDDGAQLTNCLEEDGIRFGRCGDDLGAVCLSLAVHSLTGCPVLGSPFFVCPAKLANPAACDSKWPHPVHGEENPTRKGVAGQRRGLKEVIGG